MGNNPPTEPFAVQICFEGNLVCFHNSLCGVLLDLDDSIGVLGIAVSGGLRAGLADMGRMALTQITLLRAHSPQTGIRGCTMIQYKQLMPNLDGQLVT